MADEIQYKFKDGKIIHVFSEKEICEIIKDKFEDQNNLINLLRKENTELKSEHYKDYEISSLKSEIDELKSELKCLSFKISPEEQEKINAFIKEHSKHGDPGAIGGRYEYVFHPTSIGTVAKIKCTDCKKELIFRDID